MEWDAWRLTVFVNNVTDDRTPTSVTRYVDQMNVNVPQFVNPNPAQANVPATTTLERAFFYPLAAKRPFGATLSHRFGGGRRRRHPPRRSPRRSFPPV